MTISGQQKFVCKKKSLLCLVGRLVATMGKTDIGFFSTFINTRIETRSVGTELVDKAHA